MKQTIKGILFDKDGTLFEYGNTWQIWCERVISQLASNDTLLRDQLAQRCGFDFATKSFIPGSLVVNGSVDEIITAWTELHPKLDYNAIESIGIKHLNNLPLTPVCDLQNMITTLKAQGIAVGCGTNDYESSARNQLARANVLDNFDFVCGYDSGYGVKPEPGMLQAFAKHIGAQTSELIMVGDSTHDLDSGKAAGVAFKIGVLTGPAKLADIDYAADVVLDSVGELPNWLKQYNTN